MKTLFLLRHGKSSWDSSELSDHDRPLNERGQKSAKKMAKKFLSVAEVPMLVVSSSAVRALSTAKIFCSGIGYAHEDIVINPRAYTFDVATVLDEIKKIDDQYSSLMFVGHNPAYTEIANRYSPSNITNVPTAGLLAFSCAAEHWQSIDDGQTSLRWFDYPKNKQKIQTF